MRSPGRPIATWARSAAISASTRAASSTIRANGGAPPITIASRPPATICHVAPKSRGVCFATFSGDLAPALLTLGAEVDLAGPAGRRTVPLASLYIGFARQDEPVTETRGDGKYFLALRPGEIVTAVRATNTPGLRSAYDKIRIRRSIEYPVCGVAVALRRDGDTLADLRVAFTGTNPRPVLLEGTAGSAAARSTSACSRASTTWCATRSWR